MNYTSFYSLSQIEPADKPTWLVMYNSDMLKIDTGIHEAKNTADNAVTAASAAQSTADTATSNLATLSGTVGSLSDTLSTAVGNINTINSLIGNGTPTTTDQTIIGAINEINGNVTTLSGTVSSISSEVSGMTANKLGNVVDLTQYPLDASQGFYTAPSDGYIKLLCAGNIPAELAIHIYGSDAQNTSAEHLIESLHNVDSIDMFSTVFIRKGMKLLGYSSAAGTLVGFIPLTT